jgi:hydrogenase maturation factor
MRVVEVSESLAVCEGGLEVMTDLVGEVETGDELLVHAGVALVKLA